MGEDRQRWEERYSGGRRHLDEGPSEFLVLHAHLVKGRVLDVAAGEGRNALFLARRGNPVEAIDISFAGLRTLRAAGLAERLDVQAVQTDLESFPLPLARYAAVINIRYLQRSLFEPIQRAVKPGGIILFETFLIDQLALGHPMNPAYLLQHGELRAAFSGYEILVYEEGFFPSRRHPAHLARMVARRPHPGGIEFSGTL
jgi:SAM-dependent methyltransferase